MVVNEKQKSTGEWLDRREVGELSRAVKRQKLNRAQHALLRRLIAGVEKSESGAGLERTVRFNLQVLDTQIRDVLARADDGTFDEDAIAKMPDRMHQRIEERLGKVELRLSSEEAQRKIKDYSTTTFKCVKDFETCQEAKLGRKSKAGASYWCTIALLVCLAREIGEAFVTGTKKKS